MNTQKPEPAAKGDGSTLDFHSLFFTLQGEGPFSGHRAIFVRLAGCNLQCPGCDTEYTQGRKRIIIDELFRKVRDLAIRSGGTARCLIVITGGEPLRQPIGPFVQLLRSERHPVQIESNGVLAPDETLTELLNNDLGVTLVVSPKTAKINPDTAALAHVFKYVLCSTSVSAYDGLPIRALEHPASTGVARPPMTFNGPIYVNPFDTGYPELNNDNLLAVARSCMAHGYIAGVQLHKLIGLE